MTDELKQCIRLLAQYDQYEAHVLAWYNSVKHDPVVFEMIREFEMNVRNLVTPASEKPERARTMFDLYQIFAFVGLQSIARQVIQQQVLENTCST